MQSNSPCIGICKLEDNICIGCNRTIEDIKEAYEWQEKIKSTGIESLKNPNENATN